MNAGLLTFLLAASLGLCLGIAGVFVLVGLGWALLAAGAALLLVAGFIRKGLTGG